MRKEKKKPPHTSRRVLPSCRSKKQRGQSVNKEVRTEEDPEQESTAEGKEMLKPQRFVLDEGPGNSPLLAEGSGEEENVLTLWVGGECRG